MCGDVSVEDSISVFRGNAGVSSRKAVVENCDSVLSWDDGLSGKMLVEYCGSVYCGVGKILKTDSGPVNDSLDNTVVWWDVVVLYRIDIMSGVLISSDHVSTVRDGFICAVFSEVLTSE